MPRSPNNLRLIAQISNWESFDHRSIHNVHEAMNSPHSRCSSLSTTTDSSPISATFTDAPRHSHSRGPSSNSSLSSSPNPGDSMDSTFSSARKTHLDRLPEVDEDRVEKEAQQERSGSVQYAEPIPNNSRWSYGVNRIRPASFVRSHTPEQDGFHSDYEGHWSKRRRSGDFAWNSFATGISSRFSSMSKRSRQKKRASLAFLDRGYETSPSPPASPNFLTRSSSSIRRSLGRRSTERDLEEEEEQPGHANIETIMEDEFREPGMEGPFAPPEEAVLPLPPQNEPRSTTPILAPLMDSKMSGASLQSPLQSPTVVSDGGIFSLQHSPDATPQLSGVASPALSTKESQTSMDRGWANTIAPSTEIPPLVMVDPNDEWAEKLGHANFKIMPEPYMPEVCDAESCELLMKDWETARGEYAKHRSRTEMHFGRSSRTFKLTEEKWASIDTQWQANYDIASRRGAMSGILREPSPKQPAPVARIPQIDDPRLIQSEEIVGPMTMEEPTNAPMTEIRRKPSKRAQLRKMLGNFQIPGTALGRSVSTPGGN